VGMESAHAGRVILVMDMPEETPVASNVVPVQLPDHSVMEVNGQLGLIIRDKNWLSLAERKDTCVLQ
jgi:hypothetical protein